MVDNENVYTGGTPLWGAACNGHVEIVRILLTNAADPNLPDRVRINCNTSSSSSCHDEVTLSL